ncbi:MAG: hypothetical protein J1E80_05335 [Desulfovibrionaceae bacterium]|nr:hypothetical protein [Desulfovibrionaceae bacterium]
MASAPPPRPDAPHPFLSALLLTDLTGNATVDRTILRATGVRQVRISTSGVESARYLAARVGKTLPPNTEVVVCLSALGDMSSTDFAALIRLHPLLSFMPLLAISAGFEQEAMLRQAGFDAVLIRPFTAASLQQTLGALGSKADAARSALIDSLRQQGTMPGHEAFERRLQDYTPPERAAISAEESYRLGQELFREQRWDEALPHLRRAAADSEARAEACLTLAVLWEQRGETGKIQACLLEALHGFLDQGAWGKADMLTRHLLARYPDQPNPMLRELERRVSTGRLKGLRDMAGLTLEHISRGELITALLNSCASAPEPRAALQAVLNGLKAETGEDDEWAGLLKALVEAAGRDARLAGRPWAWLRRAFGWMRQAPARQRPAPRDGDGERSRPDESVQTSPEEQASAPSPGMEGSPVIALLGQEDMAGDMEDTDGPPPSHLPGPLGDAVTVIRVTRRLYHATR